jgi:nucleotide-binding universal stress UspA family protein
MTERVSEPAQPRAVLLATDLSARCDRALDRATLLVEAWGAALVVVHALEQTQSFYEADLERRLPSWRRHHDPKRIIEHQLRSDMMHTSARVTVVVEKAEPAELVARAASDHGCDLIVTGLARDETLGRFGVGNTVDRLVRGIGVPVLVARERARTPYRNIMVATDFSDASKQALETALAFFPDDPLTVFHAYHAPYVGLSEDPARLAEQFGSIAKADYDAFLRSIEISDERRSNLHRLLEHGYANALIDQYVQDRGVDLVVLGTRGRNALTQMVLGSTAREILWSLPCDALVVRGPRGASPVLNSSEP